jgi:uncharacterized membrane protein
MRKWYPWLMVGAALGFSFAVFNRLPERIPTHWDLRGVVDGWTPRTYGAFLMPVIMTLVAVIVPWLPNLDPRRANYEKFRPTFDLVVNGVITVMADRVWERTHRLGGYTFVAAGIILLAMSVAPPALVLPVMVPTVMIAALVPLIYSYVIWKREESPK